MMAKTKWIFGGQAPSQPPPLAKPLPEPAVSSADAKKFGYENFGNTCYVNSVLQTLYFCGPFRDLIIQTEDPSVPRGPSSIASDAPAKSLPLIAPVRRKPERKLSTSGIPSDTSSATIAPPHPIPASSSTLFSALRSLFLHISTHPADKGTISPQAFIDKLKESKEDFRSTMHQDAHEFLNHLLNMIVEEIEEERKSAQGNSLGEDLSSSVATLGSPPTIVTATTSSNSASLPQEPTLVHKLFEGVLTSETRCLTCETVSSRDESFLDLSIDIEQNSSVTACLRSFSASEMLCQRNKFLCDACCDLQEAEKRMKIKKLPNVLALHLKRFKFQEDVQKYIKLTYRVAFPFELRLFNTVDDFENADRLYNLFGIVVHIGNGPHHGHYISIVKSAGSWLVFDDDNVYPIPEFDIPKYFGDSNSGSAYVLYYQATDIDLPALGLKSPESERFPVNEPSPHLADTQSRTSPHRIPTTPILPPGLDNLDTPAGVVPPHKLPPASPSPVNGKLPSPEVDLPVGEPLLATPTISVPPSSSRKPLIPVRHASARPATAGAQPEWSLRTDFARSPMHSASTPSLAIPDDPSTIPPVPPVHSFSPKAPTASTNLESKEKDKDKEKSRKESKARSWFKRKSFRLGEKSKGDKSYDDPPSSATNGWIENASQVKQKSPQIGSVENPSKATNGGNYKLEAPHILSTAPSNASSTATNKDKFSSSIALPSPSTTTSSSHLPSSSKPPSRPLTSPHPDAHVRPPPRKLSFTARPRGSVDNHRTELKSNQPSQGPRPATVAGTVPLSSGKRQLPPIPTIPPTYRSQSPMVNGAVPPVSDPNNPYLPNVQGYTQVFETSVGAPQSGGHPHSISTSDSSLNTSHPSSLIQNNHTPKTETIESSNSSTPFKRATRKMSLTMPLRGLGGKKDKDKDKDGEKRKEKLAPNSFLQRF